MAIGSQAVALIAGTDVTSRKVDARVLTNRRLVFRNSETFVNIYKVPGKQLLSATLSEELWRG